jgi:hypothetical protein
MKQNFVQNVVEKFLPLQDFVLNVVPIKNNKIEDYVLFPQLVQNFAFDRKSEPHVEHFAILDGCGTNDGSGVGSVPASLKLPPAEITDAGPPTGFCAVPERGPGCIPIPAVPIPGINPGECVPPAGVPAAILSSVFFISMITFTDKNSNAEYATT